MLKYGNKMQSFALALVLVMSVLLMFIPSGSAEDHAVSITDDMKFNPEDLTINVGDTVTWTNNDGMGHTATSTDGPASFDSGNIDTGASWSFTFTEAGTYNYKCEYHSSMTASITVVESDDDGDDSDDSGDSDDGGDSDDSGDADGGGDSDDGDDSDDGGDSDDSGDADDGGDSDDSGDADDENSSDNETAPDADGDGIADDDDECPNEDSSGYDADADGCIDDSDSDGVKDDTDICPFDANDGCPAALQDVEGNVTVDVPGCVHQSAENYNPDATEDDGSCTYKEDAPGFGLIFAIIGCILVALRRKH